MGAAALPLVPAGVGLIARGGKTAKAAVGIASHGDEVTDALRGAGHLGDAAHAALAASYALDAAETIARVGAGSAEGASLVRNLAKGATHGTLAKGTVVSLGHRRAAQDALGYIDWATKNGAAYLDALPEVYDSLNKSDNWWSLNQQFLDDAIGAGVERFHLQAPEAMGPGWYAREIAYLMERGYTRVQANGKWWLVRP